VRTGNESTGKGAGNGRAEKIDEQSTAIAGEWRAGEEMPAPAISRKMIKMEGIAWEVRPRPPT